MFALKVEGLTEVEEWIPWLESESHVSREVRSLLGRGAQEIEIYEEDWEEEDEESEDGSWVLVRIVRCMH